MSVSIRIKNPPEGTYWWLASLLEPFAGSNPLRPDEAWNFPADSWGATDLYHPIHGLGVGELYSISAFSEGAPPENPVLLAQAMLTGTLVEEGKSYVFDFAAGTFSEKAGLARFLPFAVVGTMVGIVGVGLVAKRRR